MNKPVRGDHGQQALVIYTDGSCHPNPGPGGWAAIILDGDIEQVLKGREEQSTNNRMELTAALNAIQHVPDGRPAVILTDSQYLKKGVEEWMANWQARGWKRKGGALANTDLWQQLARALESKNICWRWVRGHRGDPRNEQADRLARAMAFSQKKRQA